MLRFLQNHPFAVEAFFERSLVLTFAVPKEELQPLLPECLTPDTLHDRWGFVAVAMVQTKGLRPKGFPAFMGNDFFLTGYRIFAQYINSEGRKYRGLYILGSETDKLKMKVMGNIFTHYHYTTSALVQKIEGDRIITTSASDGLRIEVERGNDKTALPEGSPFHDWQEARKYAGPLPFTFTYDASRREVLIIEGVRHHWRPEAVSVVDHKIPFIEKLPISQPLLANAFMIEQVPYYWKKGRIEKWQS
ncbi:MAG: DUF2071 domain-containing protein [Bacteroidetes bacterium]|nr:DUF2071 domain-containing protein [Bacteroidota bacterium]